jgi:uncharacterized repeat protein (TIGR03806 family)
MWNDKAICRWIRLLLRPPIHKWRTMTPNSMSPVGTLIFLWLLGGMLSALRLDAAEESPFGLDRRIPWTTSRVTGSPEPPLPYTVEKTFNNIEWRAPIFITPEPESDFLLIVLAGGEKDRPSKIVRVRDDASTSETTTLLTLNDRLIYSVAFHPGYRTNRQLFVFTHGSSGEFARTNRVLRYTLTHDASPQCDPLSERVIIEWRSEGHDGGGIVFGRDGMLYISTGDGTADSDGWASGQELNDLLGAVLRIDVDHTEGTQAYSVPRDNPFAGAPNARPENWAYGLRNPWRLCVDQKTGEIWAGNNGQDLWETVHLIRRGENYGWSAYEGSHPFYLNRKLGPTPVVPPTIEHPHAEARSLTGGVVYYGDELSELNGAYVYGDYSTGKIWGLRCDGSRVVWQKELADTQLQIAAFAVSQRGQLLIADYAGGIYRLIPSPPHESAQNFPTTLSQTGLFLSTKDHLIQPALIPYSVIVAGWADGAQVERFMALPDDSRIGKLTDGTVLMQTLSLEREARNPQSSKRIETRLLTRQQGEWVGYSYRWNDDQTDATLVNAEGDEKDVVIQDDHVPGNSRRQIWRFPSRAECMTCHSRAANFVLAVTESQLNDGHDYGGVRDNQLRTLQHIGVFTGTLPKAEAKTLVDPYGANQSLDLRARSYLHVNCSVCHVESGGGNSKMELGFTTKPERMNLIGARPQHDTFGIDNAMLVFPGDPERSVLYQRISRRGRGQMPPLVSHVVDERAVALFRDWIREMKPEQSLVVRDWKLNALAASLDNVKEGRSFDSGRDAFRRTGCVQCHRFAGEGGSVGPDLSGIGRRLSTRDLLEAILLPSKSIAEGYALTEIKLKSGDIVTGRIEREDENVVSIRPVSATEEVLAIRKTEIGDRNVSKISNMPSGMLNTLDETQIFDLLAYLIFDGAPAHAAFHSRAPAVPEAK